MLPNIAGRIISGGGSRADLLRAVACLQGTFYASTGLWPVFHIESFQAITGRKRDLWLVKAAGLLIASIGATLSVAGVRGDLEIELPLLGATSAASLAAIDVVYGLRREISPIYLVDAAGEIALIGAWLAAWSKEDRT